MDNLVIVTGLPRSGTSMMMKMLEAGGIVVITDSQRQADEDNPNGYFELENVKEIKRDHSWLDSSKGEAVKMVSMLLYDLPQDRDYILIFMKRNLDEVIASQKVMLARKGERPSAEDEEMKRLFSKHLSEIEAWLSERKNFRTLYIHYDEVLKNPQETAEDIKQSYLRFILNVIISIASSIEGVTYSNSIITSMSESSVVLPFAFEPKMRKSISLKFFSNSSFREVKASISL